MMACLFLLLFASQYFVYRGNQTMVAYLFAFSLLLISYLFLTDVAAPFGIDIWGNGK